MRHIVFKQHQTKYIYFSKSQIDMNVNGKAASELFSYRLYPHDETVVKTGMMK